jgi:hypothetical protein
MPGDPKECRNNAVCCREMAARATSAAAKGTFENLADTWERLAMDLQRAQLFLEAMNAIETEKPPEPAAADVQKPAVH